MNTPPHTHSHTHTHTHTHISTLTHAYTVMNTHPHTLTHTHTHTTLQHGMLVVSQNRTSRLILVRNSSPHRTHTRLHANIHTHKHMASCHATESYPCTHTHMQ